MSRTYYKETGFARKVKPCTRRLRSRMVRLSRYDPNFKYDCGLVVRLIRNTSILITVKTLLQLVIENEKTTQ